MILIMRRHALALTVSTLLATGALAACGAESGSSESSGEDGSLEVVTSIYPLQFLAERVGGDRVTVDNLTSPGQESHDLELGVQQTARLAEADLAIHLSGFQPAVDEALEQSGPERIVDAAEHADLLAAGESPAEHAEHSEDEHSEDEHSEDEHSDDEHSEDEHSDEESHDHGSEDPHFWLDPHRMADVAAAIEEQLAEADPDNADTYAANLAALEAELEELATDMEEGLANCEVDTVVVSHDAFSYLGEFGVEVAPIAGLSPNAEPSPTRLAELQEVIRDEGVSTVFYETLVSPALAQTLAEDVGIETAVLDPIEGLTDETEDEDYVSLMRQNLEALRTANACS
jgi:zinc transport system substrate-binding protein